jgi:NAD(P)-dependent dehydrogenase (short-subunit alcohol dehydrogenase family)
VAGECRVLTFEEALAGSGATELVLDPRAAGRLFPSLSRTLPNLQLAVVLATTRIIGMLCPGLHSLYAGLDLRFSEEAPERRPLRYRVASHDRRFSSLQLAIDGPGATGSLKAFFRPPPRAQTAYAELKALVGRDEFSGRRALIVGGSRGLGEVAAKLLAAGGARVALTYKVGAAEAEQVVAEIARGGGQAASLRFDVLRPGDGLPEVDGESFHPDMLCYFAAPFIGSGSRGSFSAQAFGAFCAYFVDGFIGTVRAARGPEPRRLRVLYPSSVFVEEPPPGQGEYAAAKSAGEAACRWLQKAHPELTVHAHRFPRMATDQTAGLLPQPAAEPAPLVLESLRRLRDAR